MKFFKGSIVTTVVIVILVLVIIAGGVWYLFNKNQKICAEETRICSNGSYPSQISLTCEPVRIEKSNNYIPRSSCVGNSEYLITWRDSDNGSDFLIKYKTDKNQIIPCNYTVGETDFELKNQPATYFLKLTDNFLILDHGTGPSRRLSVHNLNSRKEVYADGYSDLIVSEGDIIEYWSPTKKEVTSENCPELEEFSKHGLGAEIEARVSVDLLSLTKKELGGQRCSSTQ